MIVKPITQEALLKRSILCVCLCAATASAAAQSVSNDAFTAGSLYAVCTHKVSDAKTKEDIETLEQICNTYQHGLTDGLFLMQSLENDGQTTCMPKDQAIANDEARQIFETYLRSRPQAISNAAGLVATMALVAAYKCP